VSLVLTGLLFILTTATSCWLQPTVRCSHGESAK
jgi:hypothetical protein